jgi:hypothetical protein
MNANLILLLQLIKKGADSQLLLRQGLTFSQISALFGDALQYGLLIPTEDGFCVSEKGLECLSKQDAKKQYGAPGKWIFPDTKYAIAQISCDEIYLPKLSDLKFLGT